MSIENENKLANQNVKIKLKKISDIKNFIQIVNQYDFDITLASEDYIVNAKSIMEILSLDLNENINLTAKTTEKNDLFEKIKNYIVI